MQVHQNCPAALVFRFKHVNQLSLQWISPHSQTCTVLQLPISRFLYVNPLGIFSFWCSFEPPSAAFCKWFPLDQTPGFPADNLMSTKSILSKWLSTTQMKTQLLDDEWTKWSTWTCCKRLSEFMQHALSEWLTCYLNTPVTSKGTQTNNANTLAAMQNLCNSRWKHLRIQRLCAFWTLRPSAPQGQHDF